MLEVNTLSVCAGTPVMKDFIWWPIFSCICVKRYIFIGGLFHAIVTGNKFLGQYLRVFVMVGLYLWSIFVTHIYTILHLWQKVSIKSWKMNHKSISKNFSSYTSSFISHFYDFLPPKLEYHFFYSSFLSFFCLLLCLLLRVAGFITELDDQFSGYKIQKTQVWLLDM